MTTLAFLLLDLTPLLVFKFDFVSTLQLEYPSQYLMILGRNVEQDRCVAYKNDNSGRVGGTFVVVFFFLKKNIF